MPEGFGKARTFSEITEEAKREEDQLAKEIFIEEGFVVFECVGAGRYSIELKRMRSYGRLLSWVYHLAGKPWMTPERLKYMMRLVGAHYGLKIRRSL